MLKKIPARSMDRDCYSDLDKGIDEAHAVAKIIMERHFIERTGEAITPNFFKPQTIINPLT